MMVPRVLIAGAGIGGLTAAIALRAQGIDVQLCEAATGPRLTGTALGLAANAIKVLGALGISLGEGGRGQALECLEMCTARGELIRTLPVADITAQLGCPAVSIHRNNLFDILLNAAGDIPIRYGAPIVDFDVNDTGVRACCADGVEVCADVLIGADGIHSAVRAGLHAPAAPADHGYVCWLATTEFSHPRMVRGYTGHYWGHGQRFGLIDIGGGTAYWWGTKNAPAAQARDWHGSKADVQAAFDGWAPEVREVIERTPGEAIVTVPAQDRRFLNCWGRGPVTLLGDAAHPMLTSMAQGASSAIEDGYVLAQALSRIADPVAALRAYEDRRRRRTRSLVYGSRLLARLEQTESRVLISVRNFGLRRMPTRVLVRQNVRAMQFDLAWSQP